MSWEIFDRLPRELRDALQDTIRPLNPATIAGICRFTGIQGALDFIKQIDETEREKYVQEREDACTGLYGPTDLGYGVANYRLARPRFSTFLSD